MNTVEHVLLTISAFVLGSAFVATAQQTPTPQPYSRSPERTITANPKATNPTKSAGAADTQFMKKAAESDAEEIQLGQLAQEKSSNPQVKSFGERMIKDHSNNDNELKALAHSQHISLPVGLLPKAKNEANGLSQLSGTKFDDAYMTYMVQEHTKDVNKFKHMAAMASDPTVKDFAKNSLPVLESHLREAKQIDQQLKSK